MRDQPYHTIASVKQSASVKQPAGETEGEHVEVQGGEGSSMAYFDPVEGAKGL